MSRKPASSSARKVRESTPAEAHQPLKTSSQLVMRDPGGVSGRNPLAEVGGTRDDLSLGAQLEDIDYFQARAEEEVAKAQKATHAAVVAAHYELAERYLDRVSRTKEETP